METQWDRMSLSAKLGSIEGQMKDICLRAGYAEEVRQLTQAGDRDACRRKLLRLCLKALKSLDERSAALSLESVQAPGGGDLGYFLRHFN